MKNIHCMSGLGQGYATRFVYRPSACPGATGCGYAMVFIAYGCLTFHYLILTCQPALVRRDADMQPFLLLINAWFSITASWHARSGPGVWARVALYFDDTRLTNPDTSCATVYRKPNVKKHLKKFGRAICL